MAKKLKGVIDIGTNTVRLLLAWVDNKSVVVKEQDLETTRLGKGFSQNNYLSGEAVKHTVKVVDKFYKYARGQGAESMKVMATGAVREAANKQDIKLQIEEVITGELQILSEREEALLSYRGAVRSLHFTKDEAMVFDLGGGSTEFIWSEEGELQTSSFPMGAVKLLEKYSLYDKPEEESIQQAQSDFRKLISSVPEVKENGSLLGVGGTLTTLAAIKKGLKTYNPRKIHGTILSSFELSHLQQLLCHSTLAERKDIDGLPEDRADVIVAGVIAVIAIMEQTEAPNIFVSEGDLLSGSLAEAGQDIRI